MCLLGGNATHMDFNIATCLYLSACGDSGYIIKDSVPFLDELLN